MWNVALLHFRMHTSNLENLRTNCPPIVTITTMISGCMFLCLQFTMMLVRRFHSVDRPLYSSRSSFKNELQLT
ncbi:hypothetical protein T4D_14082 [Trichinella pseudospiralis]|uniref:Uncharacterized protein n=2 Tax=Trichinella pseudospiralis TaxID=6337 RepID=A0A0V1FME9_TRIPS|nr:hypothetical protein T4D_14082 [Trichinella pseudospiralis]